MRRLVHRMHTKVRSFLDVQFDRTGDQLLHIAQELHNFSLDHKKFDKKVHQRYDYNL